MNQGQVDIELLYRAVDAHRQARGLAWKGVATETGLSASLFSRMAQGQRPDLDGFVVLCRWVGMPAETFSHKHSTPPLASLDAELVTLLRRHGVLGARDHQFVLSAIRTLGEYRATRAA